MANTTNFNSVATRSRQATNMERQSKRTQVPEIYSIITRSQATQLVDFYYQSETIPQPDLNDYHSFYKFKQLCDKSCIFDNISLSILHVTILDIFLAIYNLQTYVFIRDMPDIKDYTDLKIDLPSGKNTMKMLHYAVDNYIYIRNKYNVNEDLNDRFIEDAVCTICQHERSGIFYFNTMYGLNKPVCSFCILDSNSCSDDKKDPDYVITAQEYDEGSGDEDDDYDSHEEESDDEESEEESEYDESDEEESEYDESDDDESDNHESDDDESDDDESEDDSEDEDESEDEEDESEDEEDESEEEAEDDKCITCYEHVSNDEEERVCNMCKEYIDGWKDGWEDAWEEARKYFAKAVRNTPIPKSPRCANCGVLFSNLKRCGGTCKGAVRYCSFECQRTHWDNIHKNDCRKP